MTRLLVLLPLLALAACDSADTGRTYDITLFDAADAPVARLIFDAPVGEPCDALGCGSGESDWRARNVRDGLVLGQNRGTLYAQETSFGAYRLTLTPEVADAGVAVEIAEDPAGIVTGRWYTGSFTGETEGGAVRGTVG